MFISIAKLVAVADKLDKEGLGHTASAVDRAIESLVKTAKSMDELAEQIGRLKADCKHLQEELREAREDVSTYKDFTHPETQVEARRRLELYPKLLHTMTQHLGDLEHELMNRINSDEPKEFDRKLWDF